MKTPFSNFFKKVIGREIKRPDAIINKPAPELKEEEKVSIPIPAKDHYSSSPIHHCWRAAPYSYRYCKSKKPQA
jgi:hypothetical protein